MEGRKSPRRRLALKQHYIKPFFINSEGKKILQKGKRKNSFIISARSEKKKKKEIKIVKDHQLIVSRDA